MTLPSIEIVVSCISYQRRFCWMLSSLLQQQGEVPRLTVSVGSLVGDGNPPTRQVCDFFEAQGLRIKVAEYAGIESVGRRGIVRNDQLKMADSDWVLFTDSDLVYDPYFFNHLASQLSADLADEKLCMSARRLSLDPEFCIEYFNQGEGSRLPYPCLVPEVAKIVAAWPVNRGKGAGVGLDGYTRNMGAGYFQLMNVAHLREKFDGLYWDPKGRQDGVWGYRSDRQFRVRVGGIRRIETLNQYHLNHERGVPMPFQR